MKLYKFGPIEGATDPSPFCVKVEAYCRMADIPYDTIEGTGNLQKSPKGKLPYIEDEGVTLGDSEFIIEYLINKHGDTLDEHLSETANATAHSIKIMVDEHLYWGMVYERWAVDHNWNILKDMFFAEMPWILQKMIVPKIRKGVLQTLNGQGISRHSREEITQIVDKDLKALSGLLGDKPYFMGEKPTSVDASVYGILSQLINVKTFSGPIFEHTSSYKNLVEYTKRITEKYFSS